MPTAIKTHALAFPQYSALWFAPCLLFLPATALVCALRVVDAGLVPKVPLALAGRALAALIFVVLGGASVVQTLLCLTGRIWTPPQVQETNR